MLRFPCNRIERADRAEPQITRDEAAPMIDQQIDIPTKDGKTTTFITHPERGGPFRTPQQASRGAGAVGVAGF